MRWLVLIALLCLGGAAGRPSDATAPAAPADASDRAPAETPCWSLDGSAGERVAAPRPSTSTPADHVESEARRPSSGAPEEQDGDPGSGVRFPARPAEHWDGRVALALSYLRTNGQADAAGERACTRRADAATPASPASRDRSSI